MSNLIQNGGFEKAASFCPAGSCISRSPQWIAPWTLTKGTQFQVQKAKAFSGSYSMDLNTDTQNTIGQNVPVTPGSKYLFKVHLNGNQCNNFPGSRTAFVRFGGITGISYLPFSHDAFNYKPITFTVEASSSNMFIEIGSTTPGKCGPIIDGVSLVLAPNSLPTTVPSNLVIPNPETSSSPQNPVIPNPTSNPVPSNPSSPQNPVIATSNVPGILPNDALPSNVSDSEELVLDSQESNIFTPDSSSVLEDVNVNTSSTQTPDPSSSVAPSTEIGTGAIVGISIAVLFLSLGFVAAFYFLYYKRSRGIAAKDKALVKQSTLEDVNLFFPTNQIKSAERKF